jgi:hypothetical protein
MRLGALGFRLQPTLLSYPNVPGRQAIDRDTWFRRQWLTDEQMPALLGRCPVISESTV